jgi:prophage antirepressor-like protein
VELSCLSLDFEGKPLTTITVRGRPGWFAREIAVGLGYGHKGDRFISKLAGEWADEFVEDLDIARVTGLELALLKDQLGPQVIPPKVTKVVVLFETGVYLAVAKTDKPVGVRLRRFIVDEVLPRLARGAPVGAPTPLALAATPAPKRAPVTDLRELRELRLWRRADLADRQFRYGSLVRMAKILLDLGRIDQDLWLRFELAAITIALSVRQPGDVPAINRGLIAELAKAAA